MPKRGDGAPFTIALNLTGSALAAAPGTDIARLYVPDRPNSAGWVIKGVRVKAGAETNTATGAFDVQNQTTTMLSAAIGITGLLGVAATMAADGQEIVLPGRFISIDATAGAGTWAALTGFTDVIMQIDYDTL